MIPYPLLSPSVMRPRSRLVSKRGLLLPTIREGTEETVRDFNEANTIYSAGQSQPVSSEDYLLSICHLAHPTVFNRDVSPHNIPTCQQDAVHQNMQLSKTSSTYFDFSPRKKLHAMHELHDEKNKLQGKLMFGNSDPLEYLYGHHANICGLSTSQSEGVRKAFVERHKGSTCEGQADSRADSIPHTSNPALSQQHKSSCPELHTNTDTSIPNASPKISGSRRGRLADKEMEQEATPIKPSFISQWISDCRSAWREARSRACMLPAIAEI